MTGCGSSFISLSKQEFTVFKSVSKTTGVIPLVSLIVVNTEDIERLLEIRGHKKHGSSLQVFAHASTKTHPWRSHARQAKNS
jgi:hypothetical protein